MTRLSISILVPTYNRSAVLGRTLDSVAEIDSLSGHDAEVLVIDNDSPDDTRKTVESRAASFPVPLRHVLETRQGLNFGRNRGAKEAKGEYLVYLDDDILVAREWIDSFRDAIAAFDPDCVIGPVTPLFEVEPPPHLSRRVLDSLSSVYSLMGDKPRVVEASRSHQLPGCNFAVRKAVATELDGFRPDLDRSGAAMLAGGDTEFGLRLRKAGKRVVFHPGCAIRHVIPREKFDREYLKRRWSGLGATERILHELHPWFATDRIRWRHFRGMLRSARRWVTASPESARFQKELEVRRHLTYLVQPRQ